MFAAMTHPALTCQVFEGRARRPMALAVRTPAVSTQACSRWRTSMYWGWWLPGTPLIPPSGMLVQMMEYRQPVSFSQAVRFLICRRDGFTWRTIHRRPSGQFSALVIRCVISATALSSPTLPSWAVPGFHAPAGRSLMASSSAAVIIHPQVNRTFRRGERRDSRCFTSSWLAPAPSTRTRSLPEPGGDLPDGRGQHLLVVAHFYTKVYNHVLRPLMAPDQPNAPPELAAALDTLDQLAADHIARARVPTAA